MQITVLSKNDIKGGAAIAALRLHKAFRENSSKLEINSKMRVIFKESELNDVYGEKSYFLKKRIYINNKIERILQKLQSTSNTNYHSMSFLPSGIHRELNKLSSQILNIHWVNGGMLSIEEIAKIKKPCVWTLHDTWAFSGSEHYPNGIEDFRFKDGYKKCNKPLTHTSIDIDRWCWQRKLKQWKTPFHIVCPSNWLANIAKESFLMREWPIRIIPNPLDTTIFQPCNKKLARKIFNLPISKPLILFAGARGTKEKRKGWHLLERSLKKLKHLNPEIEIVLLGESEPKEKLFNDLLIHYIGFLKDENSLALLYSAVDIVVIPSTIDNLPQIGTEAQSCGVPVAAFNCSGLTDIVKNKKTGYLAKPYDCDELAYGINLIIGNKVIKEKMQVESRNNALSNWSPYKVSKSYKDLFDEILSV
tara:strand:- start:25 stop:1281 length:1257 start_codon:yes stop_codon:yes gene_type:complete